MVRSDDMIARLIYQSESPFQFRIQSWLAAGWGSIKYSVYTTTTISMLHEVDSLL